jgi:hypothetical protein
MFASPVLIFTISADALLSVIACLVFLRTGLRQKYPWMSSYLCVRAATGAIIEFLLYGPLLASGETYTKIYFVVYWVSYLISNALLFLGCLDAYRQAMVPLPGLARMGTTVFRWAAVASVLVTATTLTTISVGPGMVMMIGVQLMRCISTAEICLVALLLLSTKAIGLSSRSRPFGIAVGLGVMAAVDCAQSTIASMQAATNSTAQMIFDGASLATLALWITYAAVKEPVRKPVTVAVNSAIYKWDQIASALGHKGTQVAVQTSSPSFFLVDVEKVVERAFTRTLKGKESES